MNPTLDQYNLKPASSSRVWIYLPFILVAIGCGLGWALLHQEPAERIAQFSDETIHSTRMHRREIHLYFPSDTSGDWITESREITGFDKERQEIVRSLASLLAGPDRNGRNIFADRVKVNGVYIDSEHTVYIDFSYLSESRNLGGIEMEIAAIESILKMIQANFPTIVAVQFLIDGSEAQTFADHIDIEKPFLFASEMEDKSIED